MTLGDPTVGLFSFLELSFAIQHALPQEGKIQLQLPKWNQYDPIIANFESMFAVASAVSEVECTTTRGIQSPLFGCEFTAGLTTDQLTI